MDTPNEVSDNSLRPTEPAAESATETVAEVTPNRRSVRPRTRRQPTTIRRVRRTPNVQRIVRHRALDQMGSRLTSAANTSELQENTAAEVTAEVRNEETSVSANNETTNENEDQNQTQNQNQTENIEINGTNNTSDDTNVCIDLTEDDSIANENNVESDAEIQCISTGSEDPEIFIVRDTKRRRNGQNRWESSRSPVRSDEIVEISDLGPNNNSIPNASPPLTTSPKKSSPAKSSLKKSIRCPICLDEYSMFNVSGKQLVSTNCGHIFCDRCIKEVIKTTKSCPNCRKKIATQKSFHPIYL